MNIIITTLSLGYNYTKDYCLRMIEDVLNMSDMIIYITTDHPHLINEKFGENDRIKLKIVNKNDLTVRIPIGPNKAANDFNFNMRYLCLEHVQDIQDTLIIFTDCDNSFDWWDKTIVEHFITQQLANNFDFFGPRTDLRLNVVLDKFYKNCITNLGEVEPDYDRCTIFWHKLFNYDMLDFDNKTIKQYPNHPWGGAGLPAEYLLLFYNTNNKLRKMVEQWKFFHDYLVNRDYSYGTWAEGFEIGISAYLAGFNSYDISFTHPIWNKIFTPNGYKTGPRGGIVHGTEQ
jgi:hypothetical protein